MKRSQRAAVLVLLDREMLSRGSWCGETHVQKATFFLQDLMGVDLEFDFVLYRHGPFSFGLQDELSSMQADDLLLLQMKQPGYGSALVPSQFSEIFLQRFPKTTAKFIAQIKFVADELGRMNVSELERISTAFYLTKTGRSSSVDDLIEELVELKPHISVEDASQAFEDVSRLVGKASPIRLINEEEAFLE